MRYAGVGIEVRVEQSDELRFKTTIRVLEWTAILITAVGQLVWVTIFEKFDSYVSVSFLILGLDLILSLWAPRSTGWRFAQYIVQTLLISIAGALGAHRFFYLNLYVIAAKAALWLPRSQMFAIAAVIAIAHIGAGEFYQYALHNLHKIRHGPARHYQTTFNEIRIGVYFIITFIAVCFLGKRLIAERKGRAEQQRLGTEVELLAIKVERARIAREIHDGLGHRLTSLRVQLELALKMIDDHDSDKAVQLVSQCLETARSAMQEVRLVIKAATDRYVVNIKDAVSELVHFAKQNDNLDFETSIDEIDVPIRTRHQIYSMIQECLTNIRKHAGATRVEISLTSDGEAAVLKVKDNGKGFNITSKQAGFGLKGLRERAEAIGGSVGIDSAVGGGTQITVRLPLGANAPSTSQSVRIAPQG
jgi:signal transduction histidine kinase